MDNTSGKMLNEFTGHLNDSYRCRACFDHAEASVICGDEKGKIWAWDLLDVSNVVWLTGHDFTRPSGQSVVP
jgi:mitogen-activated protein kinase organizer 1